MRGPGAPDYDHDLAKADEISACLASLDAGGIEIKLGHITDEHRPRLTPSQAIPLKKYRLDVVRVLLARQMVAEAEVIRKNWSYPGNRTLLNGLRYGDLMFSAYAMLPPLYDWDTVTYTSFDGPVNWDHQLSFDGSGKTIEGVEYDVAETTTLLNEHKGAARLSEDQE